MKEIYVHNNPGNITFNSCVLVYVRSWYMPWDPDKDKPMEDTWLRVPAFRSPGASGSDHFVCVNSNLELVSPVVLSDEDSRVLKIGRMKPSKKIAPGLIEAILAEAIDVPDWEYQNKESWPYNTMFDRNKVKERYAKKYGSSGNPFMNVPPSNRNFQLLKKAAMPRPCRSCGKGRVRAR